MKRYCMYCYEELKLIPKDLRMGSSVDYFRCNKDNEVFRFERTIPLELVPISERGEDEKNKRGDY